MCIQNVYLMCKFDENNLTGLNVHFIWSITINLLNFSGFNAIVDLIYCNTRKRGAITILN